MIERGEIKLLKSLLGNLVSLYKKSIKVLALELSKYFDR